MRPSTVPSPATSDEEYPEPKGCVSTYTAGSDKRAAYEGQCIPSCPGNIRSDPDGSGARRALECFQDPSLGLCGTDGQCHCEEGKVPGTSISIPYQVPGMERQFVFCPTYGPNACKNRYLVRNDDGDQVPQDGLPGSSDSTKCRGDLSDLAKTPQECYAHPPRCPAVIATDPKVGGETDYFDDKVKSNFGPARPPLQGQSCYGKGHCTWCAECLCDPGTANYQWYMATDRKQPPYPLLEDAPDPFCRFCASSTTLPDGKTAPDGYALHLSWLFDRPGDNQGKAPISDISSETLPPGTPNEGTWDVGPCLGCVFLEAGKTNPTCPSACEALPTEFGDCNASFREQGLTQYNICLHTALFEPSQFVVGVSTKQAQTAAQVPGTRAPGRTKPGLSIGIGGDGGAALGCRCGADFVLPDKSFTENRQCAIETSAGKNSKINSVVSCCVAKTINYLDWAQGAQDVNLAVYNKVTDEGFTTGRTLGVPVGAEAVVPTFLTQPDGKPEDIENVEWYALHNFSDKLRKANVFGLDHCGSWGKRVPGSTKVKTVARRD